ncbi:MAG: Nif3-like dinuclear metal center hexameric protein [Lachnospiraceae bacterium]|nr:Nif3-like dinuclear metal center hexameric protein [Lachnospiraceae bacterium]
MRLSALLREIEEYCPASYALSWDNSGLQCGSRDQEIETVMLALDATGDVIEEAAEEGADLLITHHPLLFRGIKSVSDDDHVGRRLLRMIRSGIACYAMHTNFDVIGMADEAADMLRLCDREVLMPTCEGDHVVEGIGRVGNLLEHMSLRDCAEWVRDVFDIPHVRVYGDPDQPVITCAVLPGSGHDEIDLALQKGADVMITGDISHHDGLDAVEKGIAVIDATHYGIEKLFVPYMEKYMTGEFPELKILKAHEKEPFTLV